ncbi:uncharacterized protein LOC143194322 [Rhynchophorus ferrugineus]|uniref:Apolipophorin-III n=2 Tax=Rhynchophorus ferrugineus TaxID=354439 RepID=A0A834IX39_RHYFE|nr:hypothetical protein GWI33_004513 [Rhynchophorus ferrugineus]
MYKIAVVSVIALLAIQGCLAKPKAKQAQAIEKSQIDELAANARDVIKSVSSSIEGNLPDSKQVSDSIVENTQKIATKLKSIVDDLNKQTADHKGDFENVLKQFEENFKATATNLEKAVGPEATAKAKDLKKSLDDGINNAITEAQELAKVFEPKAKQLQADINLHLKNLLDQIVESGKNLKKDFEKNLPKQ